MLIDIGVQLVKRIKYSIESIRRIVIKVYTCNCFSANWDDGGKIISAGIKHISSKTCCLYIQPKTILSIMFTRNSVRTEKFSKKDRKISRIHHDEMSSCHEKWTCIRIKPFTINTFTDGVNTLTIRKFFWVKIIGKYMKSALYYSKDACKTGVSCVNVSFFEKDKFFLIETCLIGEVKYIPSRERIC